LAYAVEHGRRVFYPGFADNACFFPELQKTGTLSIKKNLFGCSLPKEVNKRTFLLIRRFFHSDSKPLRILEKLLGRKIHCRVDPLEEVFYPDLNSGQMLPQGICFFEGWAFRLHKTFCKHHQDLRRLFRFSDQLKQTSHETLSARGSQIKVGVHIRMGDYIKFAPQWVYPREFWYQAMKKIQSECFGGATFIVVSDDNEIDFPDKWIFRHRGSYQADMALLSECDLVLGPPSTFNRWAAFVGGKPHFCAWNSLELPSVEKFQNFKLCSKSYMELTRDEVESVRWFGIV
jgi:hypothetical protein